MPGKFEEGNRKWELALQPLVWVQANRTGNGSGTLSSQPAGVNCGLDCDEGFPDNSPITLTATAAASSLFSGWSGACRGTGQCQLTLTQSQQVIATFTLKTYLLSVAFSGNGAGSVSSIPAGIACGADCSETYNHGDTITLTATPDDSSLFSGWSGACSGTGQCVVNVTQPLNVTAAFTLAQRKLYLPVIMR